MSDGTIRYSWVEAHKKIVEYLSSKKNSQKQLIQLLKDIGVTEFNDKDRDNNTIELDEIDPFTFFCYIYKYGSKKRLEILQNLSKKLNISPIPTDDSGIPSSNAQKVWLFPYMSERNNDEINRLWTFFDSAIHDELNDELFEDVLKIKSTGKTKLTEALFNINPEKYFPINSPTKPYLKEELGIEPKFDNYTEYINILEQIKKISSKKFYEISFEAWEWNNLKNNVNYWIFQGNPKIFDFQTALKGDILDNWTVTAHKDKIVPGDKVIIWITGDKSGCYALAQVTSKPQIIEKSKDSHLWKEGDKNQQKVGISITHNLLDHPVYLEDIKNIPELENMKIGNQGTNFTSTQEEYDILLEIIERRSSRKYWIYAPGENASFWNEFYSAGIMGLGWEKIGNLDNYKTKAEIVKKLQELESTDSSKKNDATACWDFKHNINIGDIIFSKKGRSEFLGYGIVQSDYFYDENRKRFKKCRKVDWKINGSWESDHSIVLKTLTDITSYPDYVSKLKKLFNIDDENSINGVMQMNLSLNTILYGPPGTGKTYRLKNEYFKEFTDEKSTQTKEEYLENVVRKYNWWVVVSAVVYDLEKCNVTDILNHDLLQAQIRISNQKNNRAMVWAMLQQHTMDDCPNVKYSKRTSPQYFYKNDDGRWHIDKEILQVEAPEVIELIQEFKTYKPITKARKRYVFTTFHQSYSYEEFIEGIKPIIIENEDEKLEKQIIYDIKPGIFKEIVKMAIDDYPNKHAIFIDEINRGNIANIFGELITSIEDDKRIQRENYIPVKLPY